SRELRARRVAVRVVGRPHGGRPRPTPLRPLLWSSHTATSSHPGREHPAKGLPRSFEVARREPSDRLVDQLLVDGGALGEAKPTRVKQTCGLPVREKDVALAPQRLALAGDRRPGASALPRWSGRPRQNEGWA